MLLGLGLVNGERGKVITFIGKYPLVEVFQFMLFFTHNRLEMKNFRSISRQHHPQGLLALETLQLWIKFVCNPKGWLGTFSIGLTF